MRKNSIFIYLFVLVIFLFVVFSFNFKRENFFNNDNRLNEFKQHNLWSKQLSSRYYNIEFIQDNINSISANLSNHLKNKTNLKIHYRNIDLNNKIFTPDIIVEIQDFLNQNTVTNPVDTTNYSIQDELKYILKDYFTVVLKKQSNEQINNSDLEFENQKDNYTEYYLKTKFELCEIFFTNAVNSCWDHSEFTDFTKRLLNKLFNKKYTTIQSDIPCILYSDSMCPISENDKCKLTQLKTGGDGDSRSINLCIPKNSEHSVNVEDCKILNGYGKELCNNTKDTENNQCKYDNYSQKCLNFDEDTIVEKSNRRLNTLPTSNEDTIIDLEFNNDVKVCDQIYDNNNNKFQEKCEAIKLSDGGNKCVYDSDFNVCYDKIVDNRPDDFCTGLSRNSYTTEQQDKINNINSNNLSDDNIVKNCNKNTLQDGITGPVYIYNKNNYNSHDDLNCNLFDTEKNLVELGDQQNLCTNLKVNNEEKCKFTKQNKYLPPTSLNSKYQKLTRCLPKNTDINTANFITNQNECVSKGYHWSVNNNKCININDNCETINNETVCNYNKKCLWQSAQIDQNPEEPFERGYCRNIEPNLEVIDSLIDSIHKKEVENIVKSRSLQSKLQEVIKNIKESSLINNN